MTRRCAWRERLPIWMGTKTSSRRTSPRRWGIGRWIGACGRRIDTAQGHAIRHELFAFNCSFWATCGELMFSRVPTSSTVWRHWITSVLLASPAIRSSQRGRAARLGSLLFRASSDSSTDAGVIFMRRSLCVIGLWMILVAGFAAPVRADLVIYLQDTTVPNKGYEVMNIWLGSDSPSTDSFNDYSVQLQITGPNVLQFAPNPSMPSTATPQTQNYNYLSAANYIFSGDSLFGISDVNAGTPVGGTNNTQFIITDSSLSGANYVPPNNTPGVTLLASLVLYAFDTNPDDSYTVSVIAGTNTFFNTNFDPTTNVRNGAGLADGYRGTASIGPAAVPEPASIISALTGLALVTSFAGYARIRRMRS